jgi:hypothetical protein
MIAGSEDPFKGEPSKGELSREPDAPFAEFAGTVPRQSIPAAAGPYGHSLVILLVAAVTPESE